MRDTERIADKAGDIMNGYLGAKVRGGGGGEGVADVGLGQQVRKGALVGAFQHAGHIGTGHVLGGRYMGQNGAGQLGGGMGEHVGVFVGRGGFKLGAGIGAFHATC